MLRHVTVSRGSFKKGLFIFIKLSISVDKKIVSMVNKMADEEIAMIYKFYSKLY